MKITRKMLMIATASLGVALILYSVIRQITGFYVDEALERNIINGIIFVALAFFLYNRKLSRDEKQAREAEEEKKRRAEEEPDESDEPEEVENEDEENLPHWERNKK